MSEPQKQSEIPPLEMRQVMEFPYKHSTGPTVGRFLAGLKEQKRIWGQRVAGQGVVVPPVGYSEVDASDGGEWVAVQDTGVVTAVSVLHHPIEHLHPAAHPSPHSAARTNSRIPSSTRWRERSPTSMPCARAVSRRCTAPCCRKMLGCST